jgi:putative Mg2+ transporter-C (MgtC) family protein
MHMNMVSFAFNNGLALLLGALIGLERQWRQRNAGLRTNALVTLGSSLFVSLSLQMVGPIDQSRIAAQVVSGIGFLGAGLMMREGLNIRGLNTAATLWCAAAIGTLAGSGLRIQAVIGAGLVIVTHLILRPLGNRLNKQPLQEIDVDLSCALRIVCRGNEEQQIRKVLVQEIIQESFLLQSIESEDISGTDKVEVRAFVLTKGRQNSQLEKIVGLMSLEPSVTAASWKYVQQHLDE